MGRGLFIKEYNYMHNNYLKELNQDIEKLYTKIPKGPWTQEPNIATFLYKGYPCLVIRNPKSAILCGYVGIHPKHPLAQIDYDKIEMADLNVHGGLTYGNTNDLWDELTSMKNLYWLGFDAGHIDDIIPAAEHLNDDEEYKMYELLTLVTEMMDSDRTFEKAYRTMDYMKAECEKLVDYIAAYSGHKEQVH